ncbi:Uma2 family endonuclease [Myceligenerans pegani]|uniref:Uma2 family endonuclease n=1 Tax=Myceligenerans pegani TaxID=2776917 RepID=A0ABR9MVN1_9MICO|nr:Uma2 family endonuclease [Myceligenerans sp. TRM 65318]MBE1875443.1 Uma2 family endonuclease [Myceligenerans sp. TRM 65318]MBE3017714.1 Uma2 family endonuclease [Myceligenerans sp. TRM 65318]
MTALPDWMRPPRPEGWLAVDLDRLPEAPRHTELIDGALVFRLLPQRAWHSRVIFTVQRSLTAQAPSNIVIYSGMTVRLDEHNRPEPDVLATTAEYDPDRTWYAPEDVVLVVEVVSPESAHRDRTVKLTKYAQAGIRHYWRVEDEGDATAIHVYELDDATTAYAPAGIFRERLRVAAPFPIELDVPGLVG